MSETLHFACVHSQEDNARNRARIRKLVVLFAILLAVAAALVTASLILRENTSLDNPREMPSQVCAMAVTFVIGAIIIFLWSMKLSPLLAYRRYLRETAGGLTRDVQGIITRMDEDVTFREGLYFYGMIVNVGEPNNPEDERLLYWDAQKPKPAWHTGGSACLRAHGNDIIALGSDVPISHSA